MRAAGGGFDPYHKWLGISPKDQPPNHYRLLGIELFEPDPDVIDTAATQRMAYLQQCAHGDEAELASQLLNQVAAARLCLLDKSKKAKYDRHLRPTRSAQPPDASDQHTTPVAPSPSSAIPLDIFASPPPAARAHGSLASIVVDDEPLAHRTQQAARKAQKMAKINVIGHIVAPVVGLSVGALILLAVKPEFLNPVDRQAPQQVAAPRIPLPSDPLPQVPYTPPRQAPRKETPKVETPPPEPAPPTPAPPPEPVQDTPTTPVAIDLLPSAIDLPSPVEGSDSAPSPIGKIVGGESHNLTLELHSGSQASVIKLEPSGRAGADGGWSLIEPTDNGSAVGRFSVENGELVFRWMAKADSAALNVLRNSVLGVSVGDQNKSIQLRTPIVEAPISFEPGKTWSLRKVPGESLDEIRDQLSLGSVRLEGFPVSAEVKPSPTEGTAPVKNITVVVSPSYPRMEIRLTLDKGRSVSASMLLIQDKDDEKGVGFSSINKSIKDIEIPLNKVRKQVGDFEALVKARIKKVRGNKDLAEIEKQKLENEINAARDKDSVYLDAKKEIEAKERLLRPLARLAKMAEEMRDAKIHLAVQYWCNETPIDICWFGEGAKDILEPAAPISTEPESSGFAPGLRPERPTAPEEAASPKTESTVAPNDLKKALAAIRKSLEQKQFAAAEQQVIAARNLATSDGAKATVEGMEQLRLHVIDFWNSVTGEVKSFQGTEELVVGTERVIVVEAKKDILIVRLKGQNRSYPNQHLPVPLAVSIAERRFKADDVHSQLVFGAGLAMTAQADRNRGNRILQEAAAGGSALASTLLNAIDPK